MALNLMTKGNKKTQNNEHNIDLALKWLFKHQSPSGGIYVNSKHPYAYPEVTGYIIPTLIKYKKIGLALDLTKWLLCIQRANGGFTCPDNNITYIFDSAQVLRGLIAALEYMPEANCSAKRVADYLLYQMTDNGKGGFGKRYNGDVPESVHLYALPPLIEISKILNDEKYQIAAQNCLNYYMGHRDFLNINDLTHFLAYQLETLIDLGRPDLTIPVLEKLSKLQKPDGSVRGMGNVKWVCSPGLAQLAICWYKTGNIDFANRALNWLDNRQQDSGGFFGSYGIGASYFPSVELSWAVKFYLDACFLRLGLTKEGISRLTQENNIKKDDILRLSGDGWNKILISKETRNNILTNVKHNLISEWGKEILLNTNPGDKVLEIGSGTGEISLQLAQAGRIVTVLDICEDNLNFIEDCADELGLRINIVTADATKKLIFSDNEFDCVWQSGLLEHFTREERIKMLQEFFRISSEKVISMVPNAACIAYRTGKICQEMKNIWPYGIENPVYTLQDEYKAAGLELIKEYSVGIRHGLKFLSKKDPLKQTLTKWISSSSSEELSNQGYLLVTIGKKNLNGES